MLAIDPRALADEVWKAPRRVTNALRLAKGELRGDLAATPCREVARWGRVRLLAYHAAGAATVRAPIVMVPSIINRHYVLDLRPGQSMVEYLVGEGFPVYMVEWGDPGPQDRFADLAMHVLGWIHAAVRAACKDAGTPRVHVLGYCIGGTLAAMYAALRPARVAGLIALTAPVRFHDEGLLSNWATNPGFPVERLLEAWGNMPGDFLNGSFTLLQPGSHPKKFQGLWKNLWDDAFVERFMALEGWVTDAVDVPGAAYRELIDDLYRADGLARGEIVLRGERVRLGDIRCPLLVVTAARDHIVPGCSGSDLVDLVSSEDRRHLPLPGGHIGVVVGRAARENLWPKTAAWLAERTIR